MADSASGFVSLDELRRKPGSPPPGEPVASLAGHLERLAAGLSPGEREVMDLFLGFAHKNGALAALAAERPQDVLTPREVEVFERLRALPAPQGRGLRSPLAVILKGTRRCNLRCTYCRSWSDEPNQSMSFEVLARALRGTLAAPGIDRVELVWHGGETTLRPISFYRKALWLQQQFRRRGQTVTNTIQTNGTTLNDAWLAFLKRYDISVGVSLDGPPEIHDSRRLDVRGRPTSHLVRRGLELLRDHQVPHGVLMVVDDAVVSLGAQRVLDYFLEIGVRHVALLNVGPEGDPERSLPGDYLLFPRYVSFLCDLFLAWWPEHRERITFREIGDLVDKVQEKRGSYCVFGGNCMGGVLTVGPEGEVAICDKYQGNSGYDLGNVLHGEIADLPQAANLRKAYAETSSEMDLTRACPWFEICQGGCPHDRFVRSSRRIPFAEQCCGWSPLISLIAETLTARGPHSTCPE